MHARHKARHEYYSHGYADNAYFFPYFFMKNINMPRKPTNFNTLKCHAGKNVVENCKWPFRIFMRK